MSKREQFDSSEESTETKDNQANEDGISDSDLAKMAEAGKETQLLGTPMKFVERIFEKQMENGNNYDRNKDIQLRKKVVDIKQQDKGEVKVTILQLFFDTDKININDVLGGTYEEFLKKFDSFLPKLSKYFQNVKKQDFENGYDWEDGKISDKTKDTIGKLSEKFSMFVENVNQIKETQETVEETQETVEETQETVEETQETVEETQETVEETQETVEETQDKQLNSIENSDDELEKIKEFYEILSKKENQKARDLLEKQMESQGLDVKDIHDVKTFMQTDKNKKYVYEKVLAEISISDREFFKSTIDYISNNEIEIGTVEGNMKNLNRSLAISESSKKNTESILKKNGENKSVEGYDKIDYSSKMTIAKIMLGEDVIRQKEDVFLDNLFRNKENLSDELKQIIGSKDIAQLSIQDREDLLTREGFYVHLFQEMQPQFEQYAKRFSGEQELNEYGSVLFEYINSMDGDAISIQGIEMLANGDTKFSVLRTYEGITRLQECRIQNGVFKINVITEKDGNYMEDFVEVCKVPTIQEIMGQTNSLDLSGLGEVKSKADIDNILAQQVHENVKGFQTLDEKSKINLAQVSVSDMQMVGWTNIYNPKEHIDQLMGGKVITSESIPNCYNFLRMGKNSTDRSQDNRLIDISMDRNISNFFDLSYNSGDKKEMIGAMEIFKNFGMVEGIQGQEEINIDKFQKLQKALKNPLSELVEMELRDELGIDIVGLGYKLIDSGDKFFLERG